MKRNSNINSKIYLYALLTFWLVIVGSSLSWNIKIAEKGMEQTILNIGRSFFKEIKTARLWNAKHGGVYVPITEETKPNPYLDIPDRDVITSTGLRLTKINPAFMTRQVAEIAKQESNIQYHITSLKPIRPANKADAWESSALFGFESNQNEFFQFIQEAMAYRYMAPLPLKETCLKCHAKQGYKLGDIRGGISVTIPAKTYIDAIKKSKNGLIVIHLIVLALGAGLFYSLTRYRDGQEQKIKQKNKELEKEIIERKQIENSLKESEERFRFLSKAGFEGIIIIEKGIILEANDTFYKLTGYQPSELTNKPVTDLVSPAEKENVTSRMGSGYEQSYETSGLKKDGSTFPVEVHAKSFLYKGRQVRVAAIRDITEQKLAKEVIQKAAIEWSTAMDASEDAIYLLDPNRHLLRANKIFYQLTASTPQTAIGQHIEKIVHPQGEEVPCPVCLAQEAMRDKIITMDSDHPDNPTGRPIEITVKVVRDESGQPISIFMRLHDLTEQKRLEEELFQAHKMEAIGTLAGGIAHDFNNILSAIVGYSEIAKLHIRTDKNATEDIDQVLKASKRATELVQHILTFSRKSDHRLEPLAPHLIIKEALKMLRASLPTTIKIQEDIDTKCGKVLADSTNIHQIIVNLCTNSLHAMENEKGVLSVSLYRKEIGDEEIEGEHGVSSGPFIVLQVSDTGHGMDKETIERIFDPYYTTKEVGKGTGLGLAVIHGIIQDYHGFIRIESESGKGTTFYVHIPVLQQETSTADEVTTDEFLPTGTERILVVDDESIIANLNKTVLEELGYEVTATTQSLDALNKIRTDPDQFDLIITDQTMPNLTGAELAQEILKIKHNMPIILCTGYSSILLEEDALAIGIKKHVKKPLRRKALAEIVRQVMDDN
jgi:PAS domain S-box-containing protein